jgi:hypothetical protein
MCFLWCRRHGIHLSKLREVKGNLATLLFIMPPIFSQPEYQTATNATQEMYTPSFNVFLLNENDVDAATQNPYINKLSNDSLLAILQPNRVKGAWENEDSRESSLFHLFLGRSLFNYILTWTNTELTKRGKKTISIEKLLAYVGLKIAMSLVQIGNIKQYWETKHFSGHGDFCDTMSRDEFQEICAAIQFHPPDIYDEDTKERDPLYHSRCIFDHFQKQCALVTVPCGTSALDENSVRTSAHTKAKQYMENKPIKFAI